MSWNAVKDSYSCDAQYCGERPEEVRPIVAKSYRDYRNYKQDFVRMLDDDVQEEPVHHVYRRQRENANTDSRPGFHEERSLIFNQLNKELYQKFLPTTEEIQACRTVIFMCMI